MKYLIALFLALPLLSLAPAPPAHAVYWTRLAVQTSAPPAQECTFETANARLRQEVADPIGYPFGNVTAFSCSGDTQAVIAELETRVATMQAEAAAYRSAHPITGATP